VKLAIVRGLCRVPPVAQERSCRIALIRHGRSAHTHTGWIDAAGFRAWRAAYEAAGIDREDRPPLAVQELAVRADLVVASDAPRAVSSAHLLAPGREIVTSELLRELDLAGPRLGGLRLPLAGWALAVGLRSLALTLRGSYPTQAEIARVTEAVTWLERLAEGHLLVVAVTHASLRRRLALQLLAHGWHERTRRSLRHWSTWLFDRATPPRPGAPPAP
jgi:broad specificity phosphatase PhoE